MRIFFPLLAVLALLTACARSADDGGSSDDGSGGAAGDVAGISRAENDLVVRVDQGDGSEPEAWTLTCVGTADGTHPDAAGACAHVQDMAEPFAPIPGDVACTEQYGGPQTAHVTGRWGGEPVDVELSRVNGCSISQWDGLGPLLPVDVG